MGQNPFGLSSNMIWLLEISVPAIISVAGWIYVFYTNRLNMKVEKQNMIKMQAYESVRSHLFDASKLHSEINGFLFLTGSNLEQLGKWSDPILLKITVDALIKDFDDHIFTKLLKQCRKAFFNFVFTWEHFEIVFKCLELQRLALQEESRELMTQTTHLITNYDRYFIRLKSKLATDDDRLQLIEQIKKVNSAMADFVGCLLDIRTNLQNYVFGDLLNNEIEKRKVANKSYQTIDSLMEKHKNTIEKY